MKKMLLLFALISVLSCGKEKPLDGVNIIRENNTIDRYTDLYESETIEEEIEAISPEELSNIVSNFTDKTFTPDQKTLKKPVYTISRDYLKEPLDFKSLPYDKYNGNIGVVCTTGVKLYKEYPGENEIRELKKGDIIQVLEKYENPEVIFEESKGLYEFNKEYNFWYKVKIGETSGYLFGSYFIDTETISCENTKHLWGGTLLQNAYIQKKLGTAVNPEDKFLLDASQNSIKNNIVKLSYYYTKPARTESFHDFAGFSDISEPYKTRLQSDRVLCEKVQYGEYNLNVEQPDDMTALYMDMHINRAIPTFITTDYLMHNLHLLFDRMLQNTESRIMYPLLRKLSLDYLTILNKFSGETSENEKKYKEAIVLLEKYFGVAYYLTLSSQENAQLISSKDSSSDENNLPAALIKKYPEILQEVSLINEGKAREKSPILGYDEDYTQFIPRSHYTKSERLKRYFRTMMYLGRMHLYCSLSPDHKEKSIQHTSATLVIAKIAKENKEIYATWKALFNPITYLIGESDDYTLTNMLDVADNVDFNNLGNWLENEGNITGFIKNASSKIKSPKVSGNSLATNLKNPATINNTTEIPAGFRLFGQRFTFDSYIHTMLSSPRVGTQEAPRTMVKSLDVTGVMGNKTADELLKDDKQNIERYTENYNRLKEQFNTFTDADFSSTFYNGYLKSIAEICRFNNEKPFYFTQSKAWDKKTLHSASAAWAELRHDTLLYAKQNAAEMAGKMPGPTWVIDPIERPIGYIEPNLGVLYQLQNITENIQKMITESGIISPEYASKYAQYKSIIDDLVLIAEKESSDQIITTDENEFLYNLPYVMAPLILPPNANTVNEKDLQMALVADVHTDSDAGQALEVGTGIPYRMYVAVNDGIGGKRIAIGYVFSYYEFTVPTSERMNDDTWKGKVYGTDQKYIDSKIPVWADFIVK